MLKKKFEAVLNGELTVDFTLANLVLKGEAINSPELIALPSLEPHPKKTPNDSQLKAIKVSQGLPLTLVWGPPGTGKTETLARIVECFLKRGMKTLVVAHANAAVDEATEDIAEILKTTEYYNRGQIIRFGNYQKEKLETDYNLVLLEKIAERIGATLNQEKEQLEQQKGKIEQHLTYLTSASEAIQEREAVSHQIKQLTDAIIYNKGEIADIKVQLSKIENDLSGLQTKLRKAEFSGAVKRFFLGLDPIKIRQEIDRATVWLDSSRSELRERALRVQEIEQQKSEAEARLYAIQQKVGSLLRSLSLSELDLRNKEQELNAEKSRIIARISEIQKKLDELQKRVLSEARVVCTTLTKTFSAKEFPDTPFDVLVVDEASMAPMPHLYWALGRCRKAVVIVGDFLQLPPICISEEDMAQRWLGQSIYQRNPSVIG
ncbi:MAG: AAA domain-containing protein [Nitrospirota bacterium]